jgi:hypothetical protein
MWTRNAFEWSRVRFASEGEVGIGQCCGLADVGLAASGTRCH